MPLRTTSPPCVSTVIRLASTSALRRNASSIFCLISTGFGSSRGWRRIKLLTPFTPLDPTHRPFRVVPLVIPLDLALEGHPAVLDNRFDVLPRAGQPNFEVCDHFASNFRIRSLVGLWQAHLEIIGYSNNPVTRLTVRSAANFSA